MDKKELRKKYTKVRAEVEDKDLKDKLIRKNLRELDLYKKARSVFVFISYRSEVDTKGIIDDILADGKKLLVPLVKGSEMIAVEVKGIDDLEPNKMGILEPKDGEEVTEVDLTLTPGLAFDKAGYRLGYGGGYYDKFFSKVDTIRMGIGYYDQFVESLVHEDYDKPLQYLLTDRGLIEFE
ncbi:5-formyltetrahydrofolate cyclo-ligase [Peptoniphilus sp. DNF00840]|uniref:5-formyltetrahydrofolate cyclo-ligase n=1 Tax=Peptoniphilus sp. DNF00840 TaxID=1477000 RepID=UPI000783C537|nr:5-formyltetrahydrofolate cyclo-ligase [Peptoniphilus sp. DNF00840]KXB69555.1 5-formyltetrahydrofolate cyclo-ligase [Peptoniphilus sp. DNF00840]